MDHQKAEWPSVAVFRRLCEYVEPVIWSRIQVSRQPRQRSVFMSSVVMPGMIVTFMRVAAVALSILQCHFQLVRLVPGDHISGGQRSIVLDYGVT